MTTNTFIPGLSRRARLGQRRSGFTLIEVLLSLLIGSAVLAVAGSITVQSATVGQGARRDTSALQEKLRVFDLFESDLGDMITWLPKEATTMRVSVEADSLLEVVSLVDWPDPVTAFRRRFPSRVGYRVDRDPQLPNALHLIREVDDLTDDAPPQSRDVAHKLSAVLLEALVDESWTATPAKTDAVRALRLTLSWADAPERSWVRIVQVPQTEKVK